jgi:hypothetical protein
MFFNLDRYIVERSSIDVDCCWRGDDNLFFTLGSAQCSWYASADRVAALCSLLRLAKDSSEYQIHYFSRDDFLELEKDDEGHRNLFFANHGMTLCLVLKSDLISQFLIFLQDSWESDSTNT